MMIGYWVYIDGGTGSLLPGRGWVWVWVVS